MAQLSLLPQAKTPKDIVYTHTEVARDIISYLKPAGYLLDPCKGDGSFYDNFPNGTNKAYCEIAEGKDFYNWIENVDWVIGNPPYSIFHEFLTHAFEISENVCFLVPTNKVFQSWKTMSMINRWGGGEGNIGLRIRSFDWFSIWLFSGSFPFSERLYKWGY
jgi:hypothetical protein